jgi:hypothetical protein
MSFQAVGKRSYHGVKPFLPFVDVGVLDAIVLTAKRFHWRLAHEPKPGGTQYHARGGFPRRARSFAPFHISRCQTTSATDRAGIRRQRSFHVGVFFCQIHVITNNFLERAVSVA